MQRLAERGPRRRCTPATTPPRALGHPARGDRAGLCRARRMTGARGHAERPRDLPRRLHLHARRRRAFAFACNACNLATVGAGLHRSTSSRPRAPGDVLTATARASMSRTGRTGVYDIEVDQARASDRGAVPRHARYGSRATLVPDCAPDRRGAAMPDRAARRRHELEPIETRQPRRAARAAARAAASGRCGTPTTTSPHYRRDVRCGGRASRRPRQRSTISRGFRSRPRRTCARTIRSACSRCRATRSCACMPRPARPASRPWSATPRHDIDTWADGHGALDPRRRRPARRHASTSPTATACSPAASARTTAPSGWAAPSSRCRGGRPSGRCS